jgi:hypothetical protein
MLTIPTIPETAPCAAPDTDKNGPVMLLLTTLGIEAIVYELDGSCDSGDCTLEEVRYADGRTGNTIPNLPIGFFDGGAIQYLEGRLDDIASDLPEGNWYDNEGGYGTVTIHPAELDPEIRYDVDMTYREEGDYGGDNNDDDEVFDDIDSDDEDDRADERLLITAGEEVRS